MDPIPDKEHLTLLYVANKIKDIADTKFDGEIYDNVLAIFEELSVPEKRVILLAVMGVYFCTLNTQYAIHPVNTDSPKTVETEIDSIETYNSKELIKLKSWCAKVLIGTILSTLAVTFIIGLTSGHGKNPIMSALTNFLEILNVIF